MIVDINYHKKKIVIIGLGLTGLSCIYFFLSRGIIPRVIDTRTIPPCLDQLSVQIQCHLGSLNAQWIMEADLVIVSPGFSLAHPYLKKAANLGVEIIGDIELFCRETSKPIVAITGSNGKSTVTTLVGEMAKAAGVNVGIGGNIGLPALMLLDTVYELYILELSSFQLESTFNLKAVAATVLNLEKDHMDRYPFGLQQYRSAKLRIYKNAKVCVINTDDIMTAPENGINENCISFGTDTGTYHLDSQDREIWLCANGKRVLNVKETLLFGKHNYTNALAALALADSIGLPRTSSVKALTSFTGLTHRCQIVLERNGIRWINDSKATNIASTKAALSGLHVKGTLHLLLGGDSKSADFSVLKPWLAGKRIRIYCFAKAGRELAMLRPEITDRMNTLEQAMRLIAHRVKSGDVVLLSPACSSIDQFENFEQRGALFMHLAETLG